MTICKWEEVKNRIPEIKEWAKEGLTEEQICRNIGISVTTLEKYKKQYPELAEALKEGKAPLITELENALVKKALGFEFTESKTSIKQDENGRTVKYSEKSIKYSPPDTGACSILLKNKDKEHWTNDPAALEIKKQMLELQKKEMEKNEW